MKKYIVPLENIFCVPLTRVLFSLQAIQPPPSPILPFLIKRSYVQLISIKCLSRLVIMTAFQLHLQFCHQKKYSQSQLLLSCTYAQLVVVCAYNPQQPYKKMPWQACAFPRLIQTKSNLACQMPPKLFGSNEGHFIRWIALRHGQIDEAAI